jgi:hypothetical protein
MNKFGRRKFHVVYILVFSLILISIFAPIMEELQWFSGSYSYGSGETAVLPSYPEGGTAFLKPGPVYRGTQGRCQAFRFIIVMILAVLFLFNGHKAPVFANSFLFVYLIKRFHLSVLAFSLGGRAPPRI